MPGSGLGPGQARKLPMTKTGPNLSTTCQGQHKTKGLRLRILLSTYCMLSTWGRSSYRLSKTALPQKLRSRYTRAQVSWTLKEMTGRSVRDWGSARAKHAREDGNNDEKRGLAVGNAVGKNQIMECFKWQAEDVRHGPWLTRNHQRWGNHFSGQESCSGE